MDPPPTIHPPQLFTILNFVAWTVYYSGGVYGIQAGSMPNVPLTLATGRGTPPQMRHDAVTAYRLHGVRLGGKGVAVVVVVVVRDGDELGHL